MSTIDEETAHAQEDLTKIRPPGGAGAILADPPLAFETRSPKGEGRAPQHHYGCMSFEELATLPVGDLAAPDCFLFLWVPPRSVFLVEPLMQAWGFSFSGLAFTWAKLNKNVVGPHVCVSDGRKSDFFMGNGFGTRHNAELCWLGRRGKPKRLDLGVRELIVSPVREHSRKPDEVYRRIERLCAGPYVELFARQRWSGWIAWGDQVDEFQPQPVSDVRESWDSMWTRPFGLTDSERKEIERPENFPDLFDFLKRKPGGAA
jgi:N6-adenosine-specific RNA methylase IME4